MWSAAQVGWRSLHSDERRAIEIEPDNSALLKRAPDELYGLLARRLPEKEKRTRIAGCRQT